MAFGDPTQATPSAGSASPAPAPTQQKQGFMSILKNRILPLAGPMAARLGALYGNPQGLMNEQIQYERRMQQPGYQLAQEQVSEAPLRRQILQEQALTSGITMGADEQGNPVLGKMSPDEKGNPLFTPIHMAAQSAQGAQPGVGTPNMLRPWMGGRTTKGDVEPDPQNPGQYRRANLYMTPYGANVTSYTPYDPKARGDKVVADQNSPTKFSYQSTDEYGNLGRLLPGAPAPYASVLQGGINTTEKTFQPTYNPGTGQLEELPITRTTERQANTPNGPAQPGTAPPNQSQTAPTSYDTGKNMVLDAARSQNLDPNKVAVPPAPKPVANAAQPGASVGAPIPIPGAGKSAPQGVQKAFTDYNGALSRQTTMHQNYESFINSGGKDQQAALSLLANHLGMTQGFQKGARITQSILNEAGESRPWIEGILSRFLPRDPKTGDYIIDQAGLDTMKGGLVLTPDQAKQMVNLADNMVVNMHDAWQREVQGAQQNFGLAPPAQAQPPAPISNALKPPAPTIHFVPGQ